MAYRSPTKIKKMRLSVTAAPKDVSSSPIASKERTRHSAFQKKSIVRSLLQRFDASVINATTKEEIASTHTIVEQSSKDKALFSPKYLDTSIHDEDGIGINPLQSPPASPMKKREALDEECEASVRSIKQSVWSSVAEEMDGFLFMKYAPPLPADYFNGKQAVLPASKYPNRFTLVLDLDETLVHCSIDKVEECDMIFPVVFGGDSFKVYMKKRPFFKEFLAEVSKTFEVVLFTASQQCYADKLLNLVDPEKKWVHHRLFRQHCIQVDGNFVKDLRVLGRDLRKTMIIDNSPPAFTHQVNNGIPIVSWYNDQSDDELLKMIPLLNKLKTLDDVRPAIKKYFQIKKLLKSIRM